MEKEKSKEAKQSSSPLIPYDVMLEILCKLPVKSLCRFKCVAKSWRSLFRDPSFIDKARSKAPLKWVDDCSGEFIVYSTDENGYTTRMKICKFDENIWCIRYCNDLVCFLGDTDFFGDGDDMRLLCVFNLTTEKLMCEPPLCSNMEFGFDPTSKKYKILGLNTSSGYHILTVGESWSWRPITNKLGITSLGSSVAVDERLFWVDDHEAQIISFNLATEEFGIIKLPDVINIQDFTYSVFEFEGSLCWVEQPQVEKERCHLEIVSLWLLKDIENSGWVKVLKNVGLPMEGTNLQDHLWGVGLPYSPKNSEFLGRNGEILIVACEDRVQYVFIYSFLSCQVKRIEISPLLYTGVTIHKYVENHEFV